MSSSKIVTSMQKKESMHKLKIQMSSKSLAALQYTRETKKVNK